jgi:hypothetical protein
MYDEPIALIGLQPDLVEHTNQMIRKATLVWEQLSRDRCVGRCAIYKEEIMMTVWHPRRVQILIESGIDLESVM